MPQYTSNMNLYKVDLETDGNSTFNIMTMLNDNWDKIDSNYDEQEGRIRGNSEVVNEVKEDVGDKSELKTEEKSSLVGAVNEVSAGMANMVYKQATVNDREIQLTVPSFIFTNNKYISIEIIEDIPEGDVLNVKVNSDTAIALKDTDSNPLTSLDKGFYILIARVGIPNFFLLAPKSGGDMAFSKYVTSGEVQLLDKPVRINQYIYASNDVVIQATDNTIQYIPSIYNAKSENELKVNKTGILKVTSIVGKTNVNGFISNKSKGIITQIKSHWTYGEKIDSNTIEYNNGLIGEEWRFTFNDDVQAIVVDNDYIYAGGEDNTLRKIRKSDKQEIWRVTFGNYVQAIAVDNEYVYAGSIDNTLRKIRKLDKQEIWRVTFSSSGIYSIAIDNTYIYVGSGDSLKKIRKSDKTEIWSIDSTYYIPAITADNEYLYASGFSNTHTIRKIRKSDKQEIWRVTFNNTVEAIEVDNEYVYAGSCDNTLRKIRKSDKQEIWRVTFGNYVEAIAVDNEYVYAGGFDNTLRKIRKSDKKEIWRVTLDYWIYSIAIDNTYVYAGSYDKTLRKIRQEIPYYIIKK